GFGSRFPRAGIVRIRFQGFALTRSRCVNRQREQDPQRAANVTPIASNRQAGSPSSRAPARDLLLVQNTYSFFGTFLRLSGIDGLRAISISTPSTTSSVGMISDQLTRY